MKRRNFLTQGIELLAVGEPTLRMAQDRVIACAMCSPSASHAFESLLHDVLGDAGLTEYFLCAPAECPRCGSPLVEETLVCFEGDSDETQEGPPTYSYFDVRDEDQDVVFIDESTLMDAQSFIAACEHCSDVAELPFDQVLDALTGCDPLVTEYVICRPARCGSCQHDIMEKTLIVPR